MKRVLGFGVVGFVVLVTGLIAHAQQTATSAEWANTANITGGGKTNYLPIWKSGTTLGNSAVFQHGSGASALVGIGTTVPLATLDVNGSSNLRGNLILWGALNGSLTVLGNVTDPCSSFVSANLIGGFSSNTVTSGVTGATIGGGGSAGSGNLVTDDFGTVAGGSQNQAGDNAGTTCDEPWATVAGGSQNTASGNSSTVGGGAHNTASNSAATVAGGAQNTASGLYSTVAGGAFNLASGNYSFAAGNFANATDNDSFVWCAANDAPCGSLGTNSFVVSVYGPIYFYDGPNGSGCNLSAGGGSWNCSSDRNLKDDITPLDSRSVLERVAQLPITQWKMKGEPSGLKHIGPMAQDFYAAFGLGDNDRYIGLGDGQGVALAAIQALYKQAEERDKADREKDQQIRTLTVLVEQLQARLTQLEQAARK